MSPGTISRKDDGGGLYLGLGKRSLSSVMGSGVETIV